MDFKLISKNTRYSNLLHQDLNLLHAEIVKF